ncbi:MAG: putative aspartyl protease [Saprospiraceae bacterium]|jgi:predicted aspartyl protease
MKRRNFIATTGTAALVGATSSLSAASSIYSSISSEVAIAEFSDSTKNVLDSFITELQFHLKDHSESQELITQLAKPMRIISKQAKKDNEAIIYKNKNGQYIKLSTQNGVEVIYISDDLPK